MNCYDYEKSKELALKLAQGETISRKEISNHITEVQYFLREYKNNANMVLRQLKNF
jgi:hypothetical protein